MKTISSNTVAVIGMIAIAFAALVVCAISSTAEDVRIATVGVVSGVVGALGQFITPRRQLPPIEDPKEPTE